MLVRGWQVGVTLAGVLFMGCGSGYPVVGGGDGPGPGVCSGCLIHGVCYADGERDSQSPCRVCDVSEGREAWTSRQDGTSCGHGQCSAGTCQCEDGWANSTCNPCVVYVIAGQRDHQDGRTWATAATAVYTGIDMAASRAIDTDCEVWVAEGVYLPRDSVEQARPRPQWTGKDAVWTGAA